MIKKIIITIFFVFVSLFFSVNVVSAQESVYDIDNNIELEDIRIQFFPQLAGLVPNDEYATILSWLSFAGALFTIGLVIFWVYLLIRASVIAINSQDNAESIQDAFTRVKSTFIGASLALVIPIIIMIIGGVLGLGPIWLWPKALRSCPNTEEYNFYFQALLEAGGDESEAINLCGYTE